MRKGMTMTNPLYWLPFPIDRWLGELAGGLRPDQKGALMDLLMTSWRQEPPCTLQNDPTYLAAKSGLGSSWKRLSGPITANFEVGDDGRLICRWLRAIYDEQLTKYQNRSQANKGNRRLRDDGRDDDSDESGTNGSTIRTTNGGTNDNTNGGTNGGTNGTENSTIRTTIRGTEYRGVGTTDPSDQVVPQHQLKGEKVASGARGAEAPRAASEAERNDQRGAALDEAYDKWLAKRVGKFRESFPHLYDQQESNAIAFQGWGGKNRTLTDAQKNILVADTAARVAKAENWPTRSAWLEWRHSPPAERHRYIDERNSALNAWGVAHPVELGALEVDYSKLTRTISGKEGDEDKTKWVGDRIAQIIYFPEFGQWLRKRQALGEKRPAAVAAVG